MTTLLEAAKAVLNDRININIDEVQCIVSQEKLIALRQAVQDAEGEHIPNNNMFYTPMTDDELRDILSPHVFVGFRLAKDVERAVIERLGMRWPE